MSHFCPSPSHGTHSPSSDNLILASKLLLTPQAFSFSFLVVFRETHLRISLISPKGSGRNSCHLRSKHGYLSNKEESTLLFPTFGIFQGARCLRATLLHCKSKVAGPCEGMLWQIPYASSLRTKNYDHKHVPKIQKEIKGDGASTRSVSKFLKF